MQKQKKQREKKKNILKTIWEIVCIVQNNKFFVYISAIDVVIVNFFLVECELGARELYTFFFF